MHEIGVRPAKADGVATADAAQRRRADADGLARVQRSAAPADRVHVAAAPSSGVAGGWTVPLESRIRRGVPVPRAAPASESRVQRAYRPATVTKAGGASLHKSDRKSNKAARRGAAKVRSGGVFGTGLKVEVPRDQELDVDFDEVSEDGHYVKARYGGVIGYVRATNVAVHAEVGDDRSTDQPTAARSRTPSVAERVPSSRGSSSAESSSTESSSTESSSESAIESPPDVEDIFAKAGSLATGLGTALDQIKPLTMDLLAGFIAAAEQHERDAVWKDKALMARAKSNLGLDDYLALLPALGTFKPPKGGKLAKAESGHDGHMSAAEVDILIGKHLGHYVAAAQIAGRKAEGQISVVGEKDWRIAFERQWPGVDPDMASAFVDVDQPKRHIWIHKDRGDPGTAIHEGMHKYADNEIRNRQRSLYRTGMVPIGMLDEGLTEYFTRLITPKLQLTRTSYPNQLAIAAQLVAIVGEAVAAAAYYDGDFDRFIATYLATTHRTQLHWNHLSKEFEQERYASAQSILKSGAES